MNANVLPIRLADTAEQYPSIDESENCCMSGRYCERISSLELSSFFGGVGAYGSPLLGLDENNPAIFSLSVSK